MIIPAMMGIQAGASLISGWLNSRAQNKATQAQERSSAQAMANERAGELHNRRMAAQEQQQLFPRRRISNAALQWGMKDSGAVEQGYFDYYPETWNPNYVLTADKGRLERQVARDDVRTAYPRSSFTYLSAPRQGARRAASLGAGGAASGRFSDLVRDRVSFGPEGNVQSVRETVEVNNSPDRVSPETMGAFRQWRGARHELSRARARERADEIANRQIELSNRQRMVQERMPPFLVSAQERLGTRRLPVDSLSWGGLSRGGPPAPRFNYRPETWDPSQFTASMGSLVPITTGRPR